VFEKLSIGVPSESGGGRVPAVLVHRHDLRHEVDHAHDDGAAAAHEERRSRVEAVVAPDRRRQAGDDRGHAGLDDDLVEVGRLVGRHRRVLEAALGDRLRVDRPGARPLGGGRAGAIERQVHARDRQPTLERRHRRARRRDERRIAALGADSSRIQRCRAARERSGEQTSSR
jgi:hypothetical protein